MSTDAEQLAIIKTLMLARIAEILAEPNRTYNIDGERIAWDDYLKRLKQTVAWCNQKLADDEAEDK